MNRGTKRLPGDGHRDKRPCEGKMGTGNGKKTSVAYTWAGTRSKIGMERQYLRLFYIMNYREIVLA